MKRIAVLGMNHGYTFAKDLQEMDNGLLVAVAGRGETDKRRAKELGVPLYENYEELMDSEELDGVIIALPNRLHKQAVQLAADKGIVPLVEKPIATDAEEAMEMIAYCAAKEVPLLIGHHRRHSAKMQQLKTIIQSGVIGELVGGNLLFVLAKDRPYFQEEWRVTKGGGPLLINGIHDIDNLRYATGLTIEAVYAVTRNLGRGHQVEDTASMILEASNGATFNYFISDGTPAPWSYEFTAKENPKYTFYEEDCYHFFGTRGALLFPSMRVFTYEEDTYGWEYPLSEASEQPMDNDPMQAELAHFIRVIEGEEQPLVTGEEGMQTLKVLEAIQTSVKEKRRVVI
ncbi:LOW QUALITY PROTEIN: myo-inositol 2-dehydrogenase [Geomicrobium sp. JCM 19039]|nr:LOW QUALITY PROTEIN: myo-inositol 2-dehydrogenase [Geomicrobium sp. JCM 19039]